MRNIREVKVGDIVVASGIEHLVLGVAGELFGYSTSFGKYFYGWMSFEQAEELGWHIKEEKVDGVDDSEEVGELTHDEIESIIDMIRYTNNNRLGMVDMGYWNIIISKLFDILDNRINEKRNKK